MNRHCRCGGRLVPQPSDRIYARFRCDRCGDQRSQRKRLPRNDFVVLGVRRRV